MGNETSNIRVRLDETDGEFQDIDKHKLTRSNQIIKKKYLEVTYKITYFEGKFKFDLYIAEKQGNDPFFVYYNPSKDHRVTEVKSYFLDDDKKRPLLLTFKTKNETFTYRYYDLVWAKETTTIRVEDIDNIDESEFDEELEEQANAIIKEKELAGTPYVSDYTSIYLGMNPDKPTRYVVNVGSGVLCVIVAEWAKCDFCKNVRILKFKVRHYGDKLYSVWDNAWYKWSDNKYYVYFYTGTGYNNRGKHIFTYYPRNHRYVIVLVEAFFATMDPILPFCIGFKLRKGENIYTRYDEFVSKGSGYNYDFASIFDRQIKERVENSFHEYFKQFKFEVAQYLDTQMVIIPPDDLPEHRKTIDPNKIYKKVGFRGVNTYPILLRQLFDCGLFTINSGGDNCTNRNSIQHLSKSPITNKRIKKETLTNVDKKYFYGVVVYYTNEEVKVDKSLQKVLLDSKHEVDLTDKYPVPNNVAVLVDFIDGCNSRIQFVRKDVEGDQWEEKEVEYWLDSDLIKKLNEIIRDMKLSKAREEFAKELEELRMKEYGKEQKSEDEDDDDDEEEEEDDDDEEDEEEEGEEEPVIVQVAEGQTETSHEITVSHPSITSEGHKPSEQPHGHKPGGKASEDGPLQVEIIATVTPSGGRGPPTVVKTPPSSVSTTGRPPDAAKPAAAKPAPPRPPTVGPPSGHPSSGHPTKARPETPQRKDTQGHGKPGKDQSRTSEPALKGAKKPKEKVTSKDQGSLSSSSKTRKKGKDRQQVTKGTKVQTKKQESTGKKAVVILVDKDSSYKYTDHLIFSYLVDDLKTYSVLNKNENVKVKVIRDNLCEIIKKKGYYLVEHDFRDLVKPVSHSYNEVELKIYLEDYYSYRELRLYNSDGEQRQMPLYYQSGKDNLHVYFNENNEKPLLFCYSDAGYRTTDTEQYNQNWSKSSKITKCPCLKSGEGKADVLLQELDSVKEILKKYEKIYQVVYDYQVDYRRDTQDTSSTNDSGPSTGTIAGASVGSIVGTAALSGGVTVAMRPELIITSIKALI